MKTPRKTWSFHNYFPHYCHFSAYVPLILKLPLYEVCVFSLPRVIIIILIIIIIIIIIIYPQGYSLSSRCKNQDA